MAKQHAYRNKSDTIRIKIWSRKDQGSESGWDVDIFQLEPREVVTFSDENGDYFETKAYALAWAKGEFGPLKPLHSNWRDMTEGWPET